MSLISSVKETISNAFSKEEVDNKGVKVRREFIINEITDKHIWFEEVPRSSGNRGLVYCTPRKHVEYSSELHDKIKNLEEDRETVYDVLMISVNKKGTAWRLGGLEEKRTLYD